MGKEVLFKKTGKPNLKQKNFWLDEDSAVFLENFTHAVKMESGFYLTKSELIRILLKFLKEKSLPPAKITSEEDVLELLGKK